ncbi:hypothetical protein L7F22_011544 [Adiantum nelumboides]|nr:hypothetical protein [Adiantum nelumboides]
MATTLNYALHSSMPLGAGSLAYSSPIAISKRRRTQDLVFVGQGLKEQAGAQRLPHILQPAPNMRMAYTPPNTYLNAMPLPVPSAPTSKVAYSSLLMGVIQPDAVQELCKLLVIVSAEAARSYAEPDFKTSDGTSLENSIKASVGSAAMSHETKFPEETMENRSVADASNLNRDAAKSEVGVDGPRQTAMSPGTLALMCDEQDSVFTGPPSPSGPTTAGSTVQSSSILAHVYAEQEKAILSEFRDCLWRIVSVGNKRATQHSMIPAKVELSPILQMQQSGQLAQQGPSSLGIPGPVMVAGQPAAQNLSVRLTSNSSFSMPNGFPMMGAAIYASGTRAPSSTMSLDTLPVSSISTAPQ